EVNEACTLIRQAAQNEDVQINFGVVMNEAMGDEVKITVIATGFERENLPAISRRDARMSAPETMGAPAMQASQMDFAEPEPAHVEMEPAHVEPEFVEQVHEEQPPLTMAAAASAAPPSVPPPAPVTNGSPTPEPLFDDLDVPAILRRDRRLIQ